MLEPNSELLVKSPTEFVLQLACLWFAAQLGSMVRTVAQGAP